MMVYTRAPFPVGALAGDATKYTELAGIIAGSW